MQWYSPRGDETRKLALQSLKVLSFFFEERVTFYAHLSKKMPKSYRNHSKTARNPKRPFEKVCHRNCCGVVEVAVMPDWFLKLALFVS